MTLMSFTLLVYSYLYVEYNNFLAHAVHLPQVSFLPSPPYLLSKRRTNLPTTVKHPPPHPHALPLAPAPSTAPLCTPNAHTDELRDGESMGWRVCGRVLYGGYGDVDCGVVVCWYTGMLLALELELTWNGKMVKDEANFVDRVRF